MSRKPIFVIEMPDSFSIDAYDKIKHEHRHLAEEYHLVILGNGTTGRIATDLFNSNDVSEYLDWLFGEGRIRYETTHDHKENLIEWIKQRNT